MYNIQPDNRLQSLIRDDRADIIYKKGNYTNTYLMAEIDGLPTDEILYLGYLDDNDEFVQLYSPFDTNGHYRRTACTAYTPSSNSASQSLSNYFLNLNNYYFYQFDSNQNAGDVSQLNVTEEDELTITDNRGSQLMNQYSVSDINHYTLDLYMKAPKRSIYNGKDFGIRIGDTNNYLSIFFGYYRISATVNNGEELFQSGQIVNAVDYTHIIITRDGNTFSVDYNDGEYVGTCEVNVDIENKLGFYDVNWGARNTISIKDVSVKPASKNAIQLPAQYNADFSSWEDFAADSYDWVLHLPESSNFTEHNYPVAVDIVDFDTFEMVNSVIFPDENLTAKTRTYVNTIPESTDLLTTNATYDASTGIITYPPSDIDDLSVGEHTQLITGATNQLLTYTIKNPIEFFTRNNSDNAVYGTDRRNQYIGYTALIGELNLDSYIDIKINGQSMTRINEHADLHHRYQSYKLPPGTYNYEVTGNTSTCSGLYTVTGTTHVVTTDCTLTLEDYTDIISRYTRIKNCITTTGEVVITDDTNQLSFRGGHNASCTIDASSLYALKNHDNTALQLPFKTMGQGATYIQYTDTSNTTQEVQIPNSAEAYTIKILYANNSYYLTVSNGQNTILDDILNNATFAIILKTNNGIQLAYIQDVTEIDDIAAQNNDNIATIENPRTLQVTYKWQNTPIINANIQVVNLDNNSIAATGTTNNDGQISLSVTSGGTYQAQAIDYDNTVLLSSTSCNIGYDAIFTVNPYGATYYNNNNVAIQYDDVNNEMYTIGVHSSQMIDEFTPSTNYKFSFDYKPDGMQRCNIFYGFNPGNTNLNAQPTIRIGGDVTSTDWYNVDVRTCTSGNVNDCDNTMIYLEQKLENVATNQWIHIDIVRQNNLVSVYVNNIAWIEDYTVPFTLHNSFGFWKWGYSGTQVRLKNFTIEPLDKYTTQTVKKIWDDNNNSAEMRPTSLTCTLSNGMSVTLNDNNNWESTVIVPVHDTNNEKIVYTWQEETILGYRQTSVSTQNDITIFTNQYRSTPTPPS